MPEFIYPNELPGETGAQYWARVRAMGLPYKWETDKATPPGPITVVTEWSIRHEGDANGPITELMYVGGDEADARSVYARYPDYILVKRTRWISVGEWEDVTP